MTPDPRKLKRLAMIALGLMAVPALAYVPLTCGGVIEWYICSVLGSPIEYCQLCSP